MTALEQVMQMKLQGLSEPQIIEELRKQGISPKDIEQSLQQSEIKSELNGNSQQFQAPGQYQESYQDPYNPPENQQYNQQQMHPSIMNNQMPLQSQEQQAFPEQQNMQIQEYYQDSNQYQYPEYQSQQSTDFETMNDIAEQIAEEKTNHLKKDISELKKIKEDAIFDITNLKQRIEKLESNFQDLQSAILGKITSYSEDIRNVTKELQATQESFSKVIPTFKTSSKDKKSKPERSSRKKQKDSFESYLR